MAHRAHPRGQASAKLNEERLYEEETTKVRGRVRRVRMGDVGNLTDSAQSDGDSDTVI